MTTPEMVTIHFDGTLGGQTITMPRDEFEEYRAMNQQLHQKMRIQPEPPTTAELDLALDIRKFLKVEPPAATAMDKAMAQVQATMSGSQASMDELDQIAKEAAATIGADLGEIKTTLEQIRDAARPHYGDYGIRPRSRFGETPDQELNRRLNQRLRGENPGPPNNWKGLLR